MRPELVYRLVVVLATMTLLVPQAPLQPAAGGTLKNFSGSAFTQGHLNNTTAVTEGIQLRGKIADPYNWTRINTSAPGQQWFPPFVYDPAVGKFVMVGRGIYGDVNEQWMYDVKSDIWSKVTGYVGSLPADIGCGVYDDINRQIIFTYPDASRTLTYNASNNTWTGMNPGTNPMTGHGHSMAFDSDRGEVVLFGGCDNPQNIQILNGETWTYNVGTNTWTNKKPVQSPSARAYHSMVYDRASKLIVLFGGNTAINRLPNDPSLSNETWVYDPGNNTWTNMSPAIFPPARETFGMAYHAANKVSVIQGGIIGKNFVCANDTWTYNYSNNNWTRMDPPNPAPYRQGHTLGYDSDNSKIVMVGGAPPGGTNWRPDTWNYDLGSNRWTMGALKAPSARANLEMACASDTGKIVLFGGYDGGYWFNFSYIYNGDTWTYDLVSDNWTLESPTKPDQAIMPQYGNREGTGRTMAYDSRAKEMILFGKDSNIAAQTLSYVPATNNWTDKKPSPSPPAGSDYSRSMVFHERSGKFLLYLSNSSGSFLYSYNASSNIWAEMKPINGPVDQDSSMVYLDSSGEVLLYGLIAGTWIYNISNNTWNAVPDATIQPARKSFSMAYDGSRDEVILFGGEDVGQSAYYNDTWCFNVTAKTWAQVNTVSGPPGLTCHSLVYDRKTNELLLFGGKLLGKSFMHSDIWVFNRERYREAGNYTSPRIYANGSAYFGNITWNASVPDGTGLRIRFRSANTTEDLDNSTFIGPDGTSASYYKVSGAKINGTLHNGANWYQYRLFMNTSDERSTPLVKSIQIQYNLRPTVSLTYPKKDLKLTGPVVIRWNYSDPDKDNLTYNISLLGENGTSTPIKQNLTCLDGSYNWNTSIFRKGKYQIRLDAWDDDDNIPLNTTNLSEWFFIEHPNRAPEANLSWPENGATVNTTSIDLKWTGSDPDDDPLDFWVYLDTMVFFSECLPVLHVGFTNQSVFNKTNLVDNATYYWTVVPDDTKVNGTAPEPWSFSVKLPREIVNDAPVVGLSFPQDNAIVDTLTTELSWTGTDPNGDLLNYSVYMGDSLFDSQSLPAPKCITTAHSFNTGNLTNGTTYYWTVIANDGNLNSTNVAIWKFFVDIVIKEGTPSVVDWSPKGINVSLSPTFSATFDMEMEYASVVYSVSISPLNKLMEVPRSDDNKTFTFTVESKLLPGTTYTVTIETVARSTNRTSLAFPKIWNFTTKNGVDTELPFVLVPGPNNRYWIHDRSQNIKIIFNENMDWTATLEACSLSPQASGSWELVSINSHIVQFNLTAPFKNNTYTVVVSSAARDESGNPLDGDYDTNTDGPADNYTFSFTVGISRDGHPALLTKSPNGNEVHIRALVVLTFNRSMNPDTVKAAFDIHPNAEGQWTIDSNSMVFTFTPSGKLKPGTPYFLVVNRTATDTDGNPLEHDESWQFTTARAIPPPPFDWSRLVLFLVFIAALTGLVGYAYARTRKYSPAPKGSVRAAANGASSDFTIDDIFMMYNDGRLIHHATRRMKADMDVDIFTSMLTALQGFVKDSVGQEKGVELGSMEYGGNKILLEKGEYLILAVVMSGGEPEGFRDEMKSAIKNMESEYATVLPGWDGGVAVFSDAKRFLGQLGSYQAAREGPAEAPKVDVTLKSEIEFYQGFVRLKVAVKNNMPTFLMGATFELIFSESALRLYSIEPEYERKGDKVILGIIEPKEKKTVAFNLDPQTCTESYLEGVLTFKDAHGNLETLKMPRKLTSVVCPILFTDENINTAMLKRMASDELDKKDSKVFTVPENIATEKAYEIGKAAVQHHDVRLVREFKTERPFHAESWYFGKAKGRPERLIVRVRIIAEMNFLEFFVASDSVLMLTGMLAELKSDLNKELVNHKMPGSMKQVTSRDDMDAVLELRTMLETISADDGKAGPGQKPESK